MARFYESTIDFKLKQIRNKWVWPNTLISFIGISHVVEYWKNLNQTGIILCSIFLLIIGVMIALLLSSYLKNNLNGVIWSMMAF